MSKMSDCDCIIAGTVLAKKITKFLSLENTAYMLYGGSRYTQKIYPLPHS